MQIKIFVNENLNALFKKALFEVVQLNGQTIMIRGTLNVEQALCCLPQTHSVNNCQFHMMYHTHLKLRKCALKAQYLNAIFLLEGF